MSALTVTYRGCVNSWECDQWGHQNVQFYLSKAADAQAALGCELGLSPSYLRRTGQAVRPASDRILFKRELRAGDSVCIRSGVRAASGATLRHFAIMSNEETGEQAAVFETAAVLTALETGEPVELPREIAARVAALGAATGGHEPPAAVTGPRASTSLEGLLLTYRGALESWECDETGRVTPRFQIARFAECANQLFRNIGISKPLLRSRNLGSAALDYTIEYRAPLQPGQAVDIRSGVLEVRGKVLRFFHHLIDSSHGGIATSIEVTAVFFDLAARKAVPIPEAVVTGAQALMARHAAGRGSSAHDD